MNKLLLSCKKAFSYFIFRLNSARGNYTKRPWRCKSPRRMQEHKMPQRILCSWSGTILWSTMQFLWNIQERYFCGLKSGRGILLWRFFHADDECQITNYKLNGNFSFSYCEMLQLRMVEIIQSSSYPVFQFLKVIFKLRTRIHC